MTGIARRREQERALCHVSMGASVKRSVLKFPEQGDAPQWFIWWQERVPKTLRWTWSSFEQIRLNRKRKYVGFVVRWPASVFWRIFLVSVFPSNTPHSMVCVSGYRPFSSDTHPQPCQMDSRTPSSSLCLMFKSVQLNSFFKLDYFHCTIYQSWLAKMSQECICYQLLLHLPALNSDPSKL